jgi:3-hydroxyisobutyrate dehydrogenase
VSAPKGTVGFVGLGTMGWPMAANVVRGGYDVIGLDADPARAEAWAAEHGARAASAPADLAGAEVVVTMLPNGRIVREALLEPAGGVAAALPDGAVVIDMSSSEPPLTTALGPALAEHGVALVDAPVSGAVMKARDGTLTIMLGGDDEAAIERAIPVIETMSERIFRTGPLGSGHAMKALNNYVGGAAFTATCEALIVGSRFGLDPAVMIEIMNASTGRNFSTSVSVPGHLLPRTFDSGFALSLFTKDIGIAADLADELGVPAPIARLVHSRMAEANEHVAPGTDHTAAITWWEQAAGVELPARDPVR